MPEFFSIVWDWFWIPVLIWIVIFQIRHAWNERQAEKLFVNRAKEHAKERERFYEESILESREKIKNLEADVERLEEIVRDLERKNNS